MMQKTHSYFWFTEGGWWKSDCGQFSQFTPRDYPPPFVSAPTCIKCAERAPKYPERERGTTMQIGSLVEFISRNRFNLNDTLTVLVVIDGQPTYLPVSDVFVTPEQQRALVFRVTQPNTKVVDIEGRLAAMKAEGTVQGLRIENEVLTALYRQVSDLLDTITEAQRVNVGNREFYSKKAMGGQSNDSR